MSTPVIAVIGGSYAGIRVIKQLDSTLKTKANIILIEEREGLYVTIAALRSVTEPGFAPHIWVPYTNVFLNNPASKIIHGRVTEIHANKVKLASGETVAFDYAVIATGANIPAPGQTTKISKAEGVAEANEILEALKKAKTVAIKADSNTKTVVGVELAGEIATDLPDKKVTIVHAGSSLLNRNGLTPKSTAMVNQQLNALKVDVLLNQRVLPTAGGKHILPGGASFSLTPRKLTTSTGATIEADVVFICTGIAAPNSAPAVAGLGADVVDSQGYIRVELTGQLIAHKNIFSLGDVSDIDAAKLAYQTKAQSAVVASNIELLVANKDSSNFKKYTKVVPGSFAVFSIGRNGGVMQTPIGSFGAWVTKNLKSQKLFLEPTWEELNVKSAYKSPVVKGASPYQTPLIIAAVAVSLAVLGIVLRQT